jgi:hypothetical protein
VMILSSELDWWWHTLIFVERPVDSRSVASYTLAMPEPCIFCDKESGSQEHLWPDWVHQFIKENGIDLGALRVQEGTGPETIEYDLEKKINTVCTVCNNGWMSQVEQKNRPRFLKMLQNEPFTLDPGGMKIIADYLHQRGQDTNRHRMCEYDLHGIFRYPGCHGTLLSERPC